MILAKSQDHFCIVIIIILMHILQGPNKEEKFEIVLFYYLEYYLID